MNYFDLLRHATSHYRYQSTLLKQVIVPEENTRYAFTLHAITRLDYRYPKFLSLHPLPGYAFIYTTAGSATLHYRGQHYPLEASTTAWVDCASDFQIELHNTNRDWNSILLFASGSTLAHYYEDFSINGDVTISSLHSPSIAMIFEQLYTNANTDIEDQALITSKLLCDLSTSLTLDRNIQNRNEEKPTHIIDIVHYIQDHYFERITLEDIASHFALSKYSLSREFTKYMNQSLIDYLIDFRIKESKDLLQSTKMTISEIAFSTGFSTVNNFIIQFKKRTDLTPSAFRHQNQIHSSNHKLNSTKR